LVDGVLVLGKIQHFWALRHYFPHSEPTIVFDQIQLKFLFWAGTMRHVFEERRSGH
jgi:hypothetical protein